MEEAYLGEIRMFAGNFAPTGWALCNGQLQSISENEALYLLIGTTYGGDGQTTFALPDLQGRIPVHPGARTSLGDKTGSETVTLTEKEVPVHTHLPNATTVTGSLSSPENAVWAKTGAVFYSDGSGETPTGMNSKLISREGNNQPHENMMPSLTISFIISLTGIYPSQE